MIVVSLKYFLDRYIYFFSGTGEALVEIDCHPDIVYSACFNWDGSKLLTTCKDKKIRIINPRTGEIETEAVCHEGEDEKFHVIYIYE